MTESDDIKRVIGLLEEINLRIGAVLGEHIKSSYGSVREQVKRLIDAGFASSSISEIIGISKSYASKEASLIKKGGNYEIKHC